MTASGKASTSKKAFSRTTTVSLDIDATIDIIWQLLTDAADIPRWNSTVITIEGDIKLGNTIKLTSTLDEKRTFSLQVKEFEPEKRLVWGDAQGQRSYTLTHNEDGSVRFSMTESIGGPLFPLYGRFIPDFEASFEQFAMDLKKEAENQESLTRWR